MLTERRRRVLDALVSEYIASAVPVGSRTLTERYRLGVSPATVRSELQELEQEGYVVSPHTSAGRIPTDDGYRSFVNGLLLRSDIVDNRDIVEGIITYVESDVDDVLRSVCTVLAQITCCFVVATGPHRRFYYRGIEALFSQPEFQLARDTKPVVMIVEDGRVLYKLLGGITDDQVCVRIGHENEGEMFDGVSIVAQGYASHDVSGIIAVMGPTRMDYARAIPAVNAASRILDEML